MRLVDAEDPSHGLAFDGRVAEDLKLQSGIWVNAGAMRVRVIAACNPLVQDAEITGHDRTARAMSTSAPCSGVTS